MPTENNILDFTVAITTYNGAEKLPLLLKSLAGQIGTENISWEVLVVDNNSSDDTKEVVNRFQAAWPENFPLRYCFELKQGQAYARIRAIEESHGRFVGFLDDDNMPADDWVKNACDFGQGHPNAGAWGGQIHGKFEIPPPENIKRIEPFFAIVERGPKEFLRRPHKDALPPGAGLVFNKGAWRAAITKKLLLEGKGGNFIGEDVEILTYIRQKGFEIWYNPKMNLDHIIGKERLEKEYLLDFFRGIGLSRFYTRVADLNKRAPLVLPIYMINDLRKLLFHLAKYRKNAFADLVARCELQLYLYSLISPVYFLKSIFKTKTRRYNCL